VLNYQRPKLPTIYRGQDLILISLQWRIGSYCNCPQFDSIYSSKFCWNE